MKKRVPKSEEPDDVETGIEKVEVEEDHGLRSRKPYIIIVNGGHGDNGSKITADAETMQRISDGDLEVFQVNYGDDGQYRWVDDKKPLGFRSKFFHIRNPDFDDTIKPRMKGLKGKDYLDLSSDIGKWQIDLIRNAIEFLKKHKVKTTQENISMVASQSSKMSHLYTVARCEIILKDLMEKGVIDA